jgi:hypothetical protein
MTKNRSIFSVTGRNKYGMSFINHMWFFFAPLMFLTGAMGTLMLVSLFIGLTSLASGLASLVFNGASLVGRIKDVHGHQHWKMGGAGAPGFGPTFLSYPKDMHGIPPKMPKL